MQCPDTKKAAIVRKRKGNCTRLTGSIEGEYKNENRWEFYEQREGKEEKGIKIQFNRGDDCLHHDGRNMRYNITYYIKCDSTLKEKELKLDYSVLFPENEICEYTLIGSAKEACPISNVYPANAFVIEYNYIFCPVLCIVGLFLIFCSFFFPRVLYYILGSAIVIYLLAIIIFVISGVSQLYVGWIIFVIGAGLGCGLGYWFMLNKDANYVGHGICFGYVVGVFIYNLLLRYVEWYPYIVYSIVIVGSTSILCFLCFKVIRENTQYFTSAILGSYLLARGISLFAGGFPNEFIIFDLVKYEEWGLLREYQNSVVYGYLGGILAFVGIGILINYNYGQPEEQ